LRFNITVELGISAINLAELQVKNSRLRRPATDLLLEKMRIEDEAQKYRGDAIMKKA